VINPASDVFVQARTRPAAAALVGTARLDYAQLAGLAARIGGALAGRPERPRLVAVAAAEPLAHAALLGVLCAGGAYLPLHPDEPPERLALILAQARPDLAVADAAGAARLAAVAAHLPVIAAEAEAEALDAPVAVAADEPAYVMFTSGSSGRPKGVAVPHRAVRHFLDAAQRRYQVGPEDRLSQMFPLSFDLSVFDLFMAWRHGAELHLPSPAERMAPAGFVAARRLTVWFSTPSTAMLLSRLKQLRPGAFPSLRLALFCGEALPRRLALDWAAAAPNARVENLYGPTEATVACTAHRFDPAEPFDPVPIGRPLDGTRARLLGDGELALAGPQLALGYLGAPEPTAERFVEHDGARWYRTGDRVREDKDGVLHWLGRGDGQVKIRGHRVELAEVESALRHAAGHDEVAALAWPSTDGLAEAIEAFVAGPADEAALRARLAARLPKAMLPRRIHLRPALPRTASGKIDRRALERDLAG